LQFRPRRPGRATEPCEFDDTLIRDDIGDNDDTIVVHRSDGCS
jgi:hypothetical protein